MSRAGGEGIYVLGEKKGEFSGLGFFFGVVSGKDCSCFIFISKMIGR